MTSVVFVGDAPTRRNVSQGIPFVGTRSLEVLVGWIGRLAPDYYVVYNSASIFDLYRVRSLRKSGFKVVALGRVASKRLKCMDIPHHAMGHPSGRNRKLNDKAYVDKMIESCKAYIFEES
jgi:hypothetical protein